MGLRGSQTYENLRAAFARESEANRRYLWFAEQADVDGQPKIAALFRSVAEAETGHANGHLEFLADLGDPTTGNPIGETKDNLKSAMAAKDQEFREIYPSFARIAREEGLDEIARWFETVARAEERHAERFTSGLSELS